MVTLSFAQKIAVWILPVLFAITVHEVAHGWVASKFGDQTARLAGRLTLNPMKHIDLMGTIIVPMLMLLVSNFIFGWAKPVPIDARNLRSPRLDMAFVAIAGPISNFIMAILWALIAKGGLSLLGNSAWLGMPLVYMGQAGIMINIVLGVLNCLPLPPLDGSRVLYAILPGRIAWQLMRLEPYGFIILILLMLTGVLSYVIVPVVSVMIGFMTAVFGIHF